VFGKILGYIQYGNEFRQAVASNNDKGGIKGGGDIFQYCNWSTPIIDMKQKIVRTGPYAGDGSWNDSVRDIYNSLSGGMSNNYEQYISGIDKNVVTNITQSAGIKLPSYKFYAAQNAQDYRGRETGLWTIVSGRN
jgi:hypothetical protein